MDDFRLTCENLKNTIFGPLPIDEVVAIDYWRALKFAINAPVALFHPARIPWDIKVE